MSAWLALFVAVPLLAAVATALVDRVVAQRVVAIATAATVLSLAVVLLLATSDGDVQVTRFAGWPASIAIPFVADTFTALMLTVAALMVGVSTAFAGATGADRHRAFHPLALVMSAGVYGAFLAGDLFNLFVFIEVMLVPSYALMALGGGAERRRATGIYVAVNLLASTLLVTGVGLVYAVAGTVNIAALAGAASDTATAAAAGVIALALAMKAALVPVHLWLARTYPAALPAVTVLFSGLLTKVGVYGLYRLYAVVFDGDPRYRNAILIVAGVTMVVGVVEAVGRDAARSILVHHMVSQVGYLFVGLGLFSVAGLAAGIFYLVQYVIVKGALLLVVGSLENVYGTDRLDRIGGVLRTTPLLGVAFGIAGLSLAGLPPFSGFVAKLVLVRAAWEEHSYLIGSVAIAVSLGTLLSMLKIWNGAFWGAGPNGRLPKRPFTTGLLVPGLVLAASALVLGIGAEPLLTLTTEAAEGLVDTGPYVEAVLDR